MSRLNVVLALVLVACALAVIQAQHRARTYFVELERLKKRRACWMSNGGNCSWSKAPGPIRHGSIRLQGPGWA